MTIIELLDVLEAQAKDCEVLVPDWAGPIRMASNTLRSIICGKEEVRFEGDLDIQ